MSEGLDWRYYRLALNCACRHDLSSAVVFARRALILNAGLDDARRLLGICLFELGELDSASYALIGQDELRDAVHEQRALAACVLARASSLARQKKWRKADAHLRGLMHQSVRILTIRGCINASAKRYKAAASLFAQALEKDKGNRAAREYLAESAKRGVSRVPRSIRVVIL